MPFSPRSYRVPRDFYWFLVFLASPTFRIPALPCSFFSFFLSGADRLLIAPLLSRRAPSFLTLFPSLSESPASFSDFSRLCRVLISFIHRVFLTAVSQARTHPPPDGISAHSPPFFFPGRFFAVCRIDSPHWPSATSP